MKDFDTFSFKPKSKNPSITSQSSISQQQSIVAPKNWRQMTYRFEKKSSIPKTISLPYQNHYINEKISKIDDELSENIRRRIQLEKTMYKHNQQQREKANQQHFRAENVRRQEEVAKIYTKLEDKSDTIQQMLMRERSTEQQKHYLPNIQQLKPGEKDKNTQQYSSKQQKIPKKPPPIVKKVIPNQIKVQQLLQKVTFPQLPKTNLQKLQKQLYQLSLNSQHSDLTYMLMAVNFHLGRYNKVRKYFREIQMFKVYETKAFWIACETQYQLEGYQLCVKLADICMKELSDEHFPRLVFLQAKCYELIGSYVNSIVCYNQLIKLRPKIPQFYLQRALIYDKIGYPKQAKQDYLYFSILMPQSKEYLKQKILQQQNQVKRKQFIKVLAKLH